MEEIWKDIPGYEGYYHVSNMGSVKSIARLGVGKMGCIARFSGKSLKPAISNRGYQRVILSKDGRCKNIPVHRLVALTFLENNDPSKNQVNHIDGVKTNNCVENLEWCDQTHNNRHARKTGLNVAKTGPENHSYGFNNKQSLVLINTQTNELKPVIEASKEYSFTRRHFQMMMQGVRTNKTVYKIHTP